MRSTPVVEDGSPFAELRRREFAVFNPSTIASAAISPDRSASRTPDE